MITYNFIKKGQETTANALAFSIFELCQNPDVVKK
jgi:cytochrome P450